MPETKTERVVEAARNRVKAEREVQENTRPASPLDEDNLTPEALETKKEAAEDLAAIKPQAANGTLDGKIDIEARGDVKGDGGDAKDYDDNDPDKKLGVPVYQHGLKETTVEGDKFQTANTVYGERTSAKTQAELDRGREALSGAKTSRDAERNSRSSTRTTVTDADLDPDGVEGRKRAEALKKAEEAKKEEEAKKAEDAKKAASK